MAEHDLTRQLCGFLDNHMTLALIQNALDKEIYKREQLITSKLKVLESAHFFDAMKEVYHDVKATVPKEVLEKEEAFNNHVDSLSEELSKVYDVFSKQEVIDAISASYSNPDPAKLTEKLKEHGFEPKMLDTMFKAARAYYDLEQYATAGTMLYNYRPLTSDPSKRLSALWGRLAVEIMSEKFEEATEVLGVLQSNIKETSLEPLKKLQQRAWLMHWSLFIFFFGDNGESIRISHLLEKFLPKSGERDQEKNEFIGAIQTMCPHLLRYFAVVAVITCPKRPDSRDAIRDIVRMIRHKTAKFSDPITQLLECIYIDFDFDKALELLSACEKVLDLDFFLTTYRTDFVESASKLIFEVYCKIHSSISIQFVAERLSKTASEAEKWIVDLIQSADLSARIEQAEGYVKMLHEPQSTYDQVLDSTRSIPLRTRALLDNFHRRGTRKPHNKKKQDK
ncbi:hypothetical protein PTSG_01734 [Salpingoeca rosetta]|uniref:Eukaryotic translation initiation factor 3 subunit E n=1 Tax=Salpingoeca rosetta (strain ATCC 50818 / BSB-021) TaxID=946362 RepID=F2TYT2_SALR5|nr:uncharacterized protein PTSG_01734 [Salpingoeca rosetta]EGD78756.1 hypothetical protein PTSG_01734 [Salpingoeca rosetta]|eukprot:XP_004997713.1 hypothetical protein PTSG_01734 [Salpingoeca rosetta]